MHSWKSICRIIRRPTCDISDYVRQTHHITHVTFTHSCLTAHSTQTLAALQTLPIEAYTACLKQCWSQVSRSNTPARECHICETPNTPHWNTHTHAHTSLFFLRDAQYWIFAYIQYAGIFKLILVKSRCQ